MPAENGKDWSYWTPTPSKPVKFVPQGDDKYEVVVVVRRIPFPQPPYITTGKKI